MAKTLKFKTGELLKWFDLPDEMEVSDMISSGDPETGEREVEEALEDYNIKDTEENRDLIRDAMRWTIESETSSKMWNEVVSTLEQILDTFSDYGYEYFSEGEFKSYSGTTKGILSYDIGSEETTIQVADDFYHVINDVLSGVGMFDPQGEEPMDEEDMESNFHNLKDYWEVYGGGRPKMGDIDWEWSDKTFKMYLQEQGFKVK